MTKRYVVDMVDILWEDITGPLQASVAVEAESFEAAIGAAAAKLERLYGGTVLNFLLDEDEVDSRADSHHIV